jgi:hypothetical protein
MRRIDLDRHHEETQRWRGHLEKFHNQSANRINLIPHTLSSVAKHAPDAVLIRKLNGWHGAHRHGAANTADTDLV